MKRALPATSAAIAGLALITLSAPAGIAADTPNATPQHVDDFQLTDHTRLAQHLYYFGYTPAIVMMTRSNGTRTADAELQKLADAYKAKGVIVWALDSNLADSRDAVAAEAAKAGLTVPILMDEQQLVGESLGVQREGEVFVIDPKTWTVAYRGPLDGHAGQAVEALLAGQKPSVTRVALTAGKPVAFPERAHAADFAKISYSKDIAPILQEKCVSCHVNGGIGPFAMNSYDVIKGFSPMIRETVRTRLMPPYFADPHIGVFKNDQGLSPDQTKLLVHWIEAGAPRGEGPDPLLANASKHAPEWPTQLGKPDVIVDLPAFKVPATGLVEYQNVRVDNPFSRDTWLRAIAMKPGDRRVLHHVVSNHVPDPNQPAAAIPGGSVGSYTPGAEPQVMADGSGAPVPAGGKLNFQMHYTTMGKEAWDKTEVGFYTLKTPPQYIKRSAVISTFALMIPAGEARHQEIAYLTFPADAYLYTLYPHAHYRGMHVELKAKTPDGKEQMLLSLPKYDFNWQRDYDPVKPILVKAGTKLVATWVYDNSEHNPANPDPKRNVTWGEQTPDEMMYFRVNYRWADETVTNVRNDLQQKLFASQMMGSLDSNLDGKIEPNELKGPLAGLKARFAELDLNHDGVLDAKELSAAMPSRRMARGKGETPDL
ncbi:redoxin domain-containing protein [Phenylobacterium sp.]|jgi:peroxiredoxin|uniref:redoxin domain-containing protein n=1 Tax=Phenylobacterium sp. TaxID=1871053 RepID=UPI002E350D9C|nr:redoxin domain-containing protein [Phenylobacterium sp.]HEX4710973.1 redoxin domain-containing protein [Phenylobacterium sp.]